VKAIESGDIQKEDYLQETRNDGTKRNRRFDEKIHLLRGYLPDFLVDHSKIYSIVSKGIHELNEDECKKYFPVLLGSIESILDEEIERVNKANKSKDIANKLSAISV